MMRDGLSAEAQIPPPVPADGKNLTPLATILTFDPASVADRGAHAVLFSPKRRMTRDRTCQAEAREPERSPSRHQTIPVMS